jgi:hypothetical protein
LGGEDGTQSAIAKGPCARNGAALSERTSGPESGGRAVPSIAVLCHSLPFGANSPQPGGHFVFDLWHTHVIPDGWSLILAQTKGQNFDSSDVAPVTDPAHPFGPGDPFPGTVDITLSGRRSAKRIYQRTRPLFWVAFLLRVAAEAE